MFENNKDPHQMLESKIKSSLDFVHNLINNGQFKKLAEYVLMKTNDRSDTYIFEELGALKEIIDGKLHQIKLSLIHI